MHHRRLCGKYVVIHFQFFRINRETLAVLKSTLLLVFRQILTEVRFVRHHDILLQFSAISPVRQIVHRMSRYAESLRKCIRIYISILPAALANLDEACIYRLRILIQEAQIAVDICFLLQGYLLAEPFLCLAYRNLLHEDSPQVFPEVR